MKTERRHELATNVLADWLGEKIEALKPYSAAVSATALAVVVVVFAAVFWYQKREAGMAEAWEKYFIALEEQSPDQAGDKLEAVAIDYPQSTAGLWSRLSLADTQLANGVNDLFKDRSAARKALEQAVDGYQAVLDHAPDDSLLAERATLGLAEAYESKDDLDAARKQYQALLAGWPNGAFSSMAKSRLDDLERKSTKDFYDWFAKQSPHDLLPRKTGKPGEKPAFDFDKLSDEPFTSDINVGGKKVSGNVRKPASESDGESAEDGDSVSTPESSDDSPDKETSGQGDKGQGERER
jgi:tetratricopeptide (TPR) repeat protein